MTTDLPVRNLVALLPREHMYSHVLRIAEANGAKDAGHFLSVLLEPENPRYYRNFPYDCGKRGGDLRLRLAHGDYLVETSLIPGLGPFLTRTGMDCFVRTFSSTTKNRYHHAFALDVRRCPECWRESIERYGTPYILRDHLMPVTVCSRHGCALETYEGKVGGEFLPDARWVPCTPNPIAGKVAAFCSDLLDADLQCSFEDVKEAARQVVLSRFGTSLYNKRTRAELGRECGVEAVGNVLRKLSTNISTDKMEPVISAVAYLFGTVDEMKGMISGRSQRETFDKVSQSGFRLVGPWREDCITVRCLKCGTEVRTTPHLVNTGVGCPVCTEGLPLPELIERQMRFRNPNIRILSPILGYTVNTKVDSGSGPVEISPEHYIDMDDLITPTKKRAPVTEEQMREEVEGDGRYRLVGSEKTKGQIRLHVHDTRCGGDFYIYRNNFLINSSCRCCQNIRLSDKWFNEKVQRETAGAWELVGEFYRMDSPVSLREVSTGSILTGCAETLLGDLRRSSRKVSREAERAAIKARIDDSVEGVFRLVDFEDIADVKYLSYHLCGLCKKGVLKRLEPSIYCRADMIVTPMELADYRFVKRDGRRLGVHIGNTFLKDLGFDVEDPVPSIATTRTDEQQWTRKTKVMGAEFNIIYSPIPIDESNWKALNLVLFYKFANDIEIRDSRLVDALRRWSDENGIVMDDFRPFRPFLSAGIITAIGNVVRRVS